MNFLQETIRAIKDSGHKTSDIVFIGSEESGHQCTWAQFKKLADIKYDNGYGTAKIASDLIVVFSDGATMWRGEYDGSEWWNYDRPFVMPVNSLPIKNLRAEHGGNLAELNK